MAQAVVLLTCIREVLDSNVEIPPTFPHFIKANVGKIDYLNSYIKKI